MLAAPTAARIELPEFVTEKTVERAYVRAREMQQQHLHRPTAKPYTRAWALRGVNAARHRDPKLLRFLEYAAEVLRKLNDGQVSRLEQEGFRRQDYTEFSTWKEAYRKADELARDESCDPAVFQWIYGAAAEAVFGPL